LSLFCWKYTTKTFLIVLFPCTALASYFMNSYNIVIDTTMIQNTLDTDIHESSDLFSLRMFLNVIVWGLLPALLIYKLNINYQSLRKELLSKAMLAVSTLSISLVVILLSSNHFASFFRENKLLRYYTNPLTYIYSTGVFVSERFSSPE